MPRTLAHDTSRYVRISTKIKIKMVLDDPLAEIK